MSDRMPNSRQPAPLTEANAPPEPTALFRAWIAAAVEAELPEPNAMTLATATAEGRPAARVVLLRNFDVRGFCFFTNYMSRKGHELAASPYAALVFLWVPLHRQVRVEGRVEQLPAAESDAYFASRPLGAQLGAWASVQSQVLASRAELEAELAAAEARFAGQTPPRPPHWGGYRVIPDVIEFWQGREYRLHDRLRYTLAADGSWLRERLAP